MKVCVIGLGKIGLPLAVQAALTGHRVIGYDIASAVVDLINNGKAPFPNEPGLEKYLSEVVDSKTLSASTESREALRDAEVVLICTPLIIDPKTKVADFTTLDAVVSDLERDLSPGALVVLETTVPVGTTRERVHKRLQRKTASTRGDTLIAFSPERVSSGTVFADFSRYPKIVGGVDEFSTEKAGRFYESIFQFDIRTELSMPNGVWKVSSLETAEMIKLCETVYRDVNIALANTFAQDSHSLGLDFDEIRTGANSQPYSHIHSSGISVGGHCIPVYPYLYMQGLGESALLTEARRINDSMPKLACSRLETSLGHLKGRKILIAGVSYRSGVKETAFSGAFDLRDELLSRGASVFALDPLYTSEELHELGFEPHFESDEIEGIMIHSLDDSFFNWKKGEFPRCEIVINGRGIGLREDLRGGLRWVNLF